MKDELKHYGVLGMKWGVRKKQPSPDTIRKKKMKRSVKQRRLLSDKDLERKIQRLKLEKQLRELTKEEIEPGKKFVEDAIKSGAGKALVAVTAGATLYGLKLLLKDKANVPKVFKDFDINKMIKEIPNLK